MKDESVANIVDTVLKITIEASRVFNDVPYIQAFAGVLTKIINIRDEIQTEKDRSQELIDKILRRSKVILDGLLRVGSSPNRDQLSDVEENLKDYNDLLGKLLTVLETHASKNRFHQFVNRKSRLGNLETYDRLVNDFNTDFVTHLHIQSHLASMSQQTSLPSHGSDMVSYKPVLPPPSELMIGRGKDMSEVLDTLLHNTRARIAILGPGGMGKTTLALASLHDPAVIEHFPSRYFVSCEAVTSTSSLVGEIANALRIPPAKRDQHLIKVVLSSFHGNTVLCLDNFETIWDNEATRSDLEGFLSHLNHLPHLAIIVTMRGTQRPSRVSWSKPFLPPLEKLSEADARRIFEAIGGKVDIFVEKLLKATDGIPLAITLVSALLQEGKETSESLWARWEKTRTAVVENDSNDRLSNLDTSIHLSVYGPRMLADPNTVSILAMLSFLPDGFPNTGSGSAIDELQRHLPGDTHLREAILTMRRVSLIQLDVETNRLRMLAPIRHFCERRLETPEVLRSGLTAFYTEMVNNFPDVEDPAGHAVISAELCNIQEVFVESCKRRSGDHAVVRACIGYTQWLYYLGNPAEDVICLAMEGVVGAPGLLADCYFALSRMHLGRGKLDEAQASCKRAVELHRQVHDVLGEAKDVQSLGYIHSRLSELDEAEASLERAIELHRETHDVRGEADAVRRLGDVHLRRDKLDEAEASFESAKQLHRQAHSVRGEADAFQRLGTVHFQRYKLDEAQASIERAVSLHRQARDVCGEAYDMLMLGYVHVGRNKLDEAQASLKRALEIHRGAHDVLGEAHSVHKLGHVYLLQYKLGEAKASFERAIQLHRQVHDVLGEAEDVNFLGEVHLRRSELDEAEASFERAIELHRQAGTVLGEGNDVEKLGDVYFRRDKLDEAHAFFERAVQLHRQAHDVLGEADDVQRLGDVYLRQDKLAEAQTSFERALQLHMQAHYIPGQADDIRRLGEVHLRHSRLDEAQGSFERAIELHRQEHDVLGEAYDVQNLGDVHFRRNSIEEAQTSFEHAIRLHRQAHDTFGEAHGVHKLGNVHLQLSRLDEAKESFEKALALFQQAHSIFGEAGGHLSHGRLYLQQDNVEEAEVCFNRALLLYRQAQAPDSDEAAVLQLLEQLSVRKQQLSQTPQLSQSTRLEVH